MAPALDFQSRRRPNWAAPWGPTLDVLDPKKPEVTDTSPTPMTPKRKRCENMGKKLETCGKMMKNDENMMKHDETMRKDVEKG